MCNPQEQELELQMQALRESEWGKRVVLEKENTVLEEKVAEEERLLYNFTCICTCTCTYMYRWHLYR